MIVPSNMHNRLARKCAVLTGAASGIGAATARLFAREGASVSILDIDDAAAQQLAREICDGGGEAVGWRCDVADAEQVNAAIAGTVARYGAIHVLFNNAGIALRASVTEQSEETWDRVLAVNVKGAYLCSRVALPHFAAAGGSIIHTSSVTGITGVRGRAAYSAAKAALVGLARNMALDYAQRKIRVNCVCPGFVRTPFIGSILADEERTQRLTALHPLGRLGVPEDIANAVLFLASDESSWMTGQSMVVDGGFSVGHASEI
jgi:NAD(P)-dependent dehydrogenase (short-subunit alcohol dehydrogenase family)